MNDQKLTENILDYYNELKDHYNDMSTAFGYDDAGTQRAQLAYTTILILIEKLGLDESFWFNRGHHCLYGPVGRYLFTLFYN